MKVFSFHPGAERRLIFTSYGILSLYRKPEDTVIAFLHRWAPELAALPAHELLTPSFWTALCLAASGGNPAYYNYCLHLAAHLQQILDNMKHFEGEKRTVFAEHGICAIPLPIARFLADDPALQPSALHSPAVSFNLAYKWADALIEQFNRVNHRPPNVLQVALILRSSDIAQVRNSNPYRVPFRGSFLPDFIGYYNTALHLTYQTKDINHVSENGNPDHRDPASPKCRTAGEDQKPPGDQ